MTELIVIIQVSEVYNYIPDEPTAGQCSMLLHSLSSQPSDRTLAAHVSTQHTSLHRRQFSQTQSAHLQQITLHVTHGKTAFTASIARLPDQQQASYSLQAHLTHKHILSDP